MTVPVYYSRSLYYMTPALESATESCSRSVFLTYYTFSLMVLYHCLFLTVAPHCCSFFFTRRGPSPDFIGAKHFYVFQKINQ